LHRSGAAYCRRRLFAVFRAPTLAGPSGAIRVMQTAGFFPSVRSMMRRHFRLPLQGSIFCHHLGINANIIASRAPDVAVNSKNPTK